SSDRISAQLRSGWSWATDTTSILVARRPARDTTVATRSTESAVTVLTAFDTVSSGAPASINAASSMSPATPAVASIQACRPTSGGVTRPTVDGCALDELLVGSYARRPTTSRPAERCGDVGQHLVVLLGGQVRIGYRRGGAWVAGADRPGTSREGMAPTSGNPHRRVRRQW